MCSPLCNSGCPLCGMSGDRAVTETMCKCQVRIIAAHTWTSKQL